MNKASSPEFDAFKAVYDALDPLDPDTRSRVVKSVVMLLGIDADGMVEPDESGAGEAAEAASSTGGKVGASYPTFAELYADANPKTNPDRALLAGYWIQVCQGNDKFTGQGANTELTHLGHKVGNITYAINALRGSDPALVIQLRKSGTTRQARKTYKVTDAGLKRVEEMIRG